MQAFAQKVTLVGSVEFQSNWHVYSSVSPNEFTEAYSRERMHKIAGFVMCVMLKMKDMPADGAVALRPFQGFALG